MTAKNTFEDATVAKLESMRLVSTNVVRRLWTTRLFRPTYIYVVTPTALYLRFAK